MISDRAKMPPRALVRVAERARTVMAAAHRRMVPGHVALLEMLAAGWLTQAIHAAADLGVADALADGPRDGADLAQAVGADEDALHRLLRLLISHGIFTRRRDGRYALTPMAQALRADSVVSLRDAALFFGSKIHRDNWTQLVDVVRSGDAVGGTVDGIPLFDYLRTDRELGALFDRAMTSIDDLGRLPLLSAYDFGRYRTLVDVGGGRGALLTEILRRAPQSRGILFDLPEVVADARPRLTELGVADRCAVVAGSFFDAVPEGGDAYLLKHVIHDWPVDQATRILRNVRAAMSPQARLLLIELVLPDDARPHPSKYIDLEMLVNTGGRERNAAEYRALLAECGFTLASVTPTLSPENVLEAVPVR
ncbi:hydroxyneurosporene methyltransferase [Nocardia cyriacigeorgica]|uniref:Hydroxyneurosporene methyltransferase n=1 Tax=Nocardia cyriacigeorgica TaxID=135487 RepID=A0A6P1D5W7_9NOCA|nr:methyltransferase [Nocardia cyriacigeorgica]NEW42332.1 hydroxyneurosporene methyltransferase [Nocardia cyriacigeorgica]NEW46035.1 hydroxyneurosporene methyltransferase [Nocardia cyriacigeorgica]NEW53228.1 hydroxyneurosporene methyltransferase [Nocardia cyriacigeorgica]NEW57791.1 hydroxyneurosporene methyltransferase [Nocardia cyriacigeorgica]